MCYRQWGWSGLKVTRKQEFYEAREMTQSHFSEIYDLRKSKSVLWNFAMKMDSLNNRFIKQINKQKNTKKI